MAISLTRLDGASAATAARINRIADAAERADGYEPLNEQTRFDLRDARREAWILTAPTSAGEPRDVGLLVTGNGELDAVIDPAHRRQGYAAAALTQALARHQPTSSTESSSAVSSSAVTLDAEPPALTAWAHGDHPGARALARQFGFTAERTLLQLRRDLSATPGPQPSAPASATTVDVFRPGTDETEWLSLNALVFAGHPEQGALTLEDLEARCAEHWFDAQDFLIARDASGSMIGYNWLKVEGSLGEIYVIGVHPDAAGQGLGHTLMEAGLTRLRDRGCETVALYVEAESSGPVHLYRSLGFTDFTVDVQYRQLPG